MSVCRSHTSTVVCLFRRDATGGESFWNRRDDEKEGGSLFDLLSPPNSRCRLSMTISLDTFSHTHPRVRTMSVFFLRGFGVDFELVLVGRGRVFFSIGNVDVLYYWCVYYLGFEPWPEWCYCRMHPKVDCYRTHTLTTTLFQLISSASSILD